ncbi:family 20 glycosylhydrolase [Cohnella fermenti]|nr:family 20 glycosylhydrolase [Cohnella fermenti]
MDNAANKAANNAMHDAANSAANNAMSNAAKNTAANTANTKSPGSPRLPLLPQPLAAERRHGRFAAAASGLELRLPPSLCWLAEEIAAYWVRKYGVPLHTECQVAEEDWSWQLTVPLNRAAHSSASLPPPSPLGQEAYELGVGPEGIRVRAGGYRGAMYAWFTLKQWLDAHEGTEAPGLLVRDEPAHAIRGMHLDLKGAVPTAAYLMETIARLASFKINTLMIEYENQFEFVSAAAGVHKRGGLTAKQREDAISCARRYGMETIPVVQCLGHADYVLQSDAYAKLREDGLISQYCPSHPGTFAHVAAMIDEIAEAHPDSAYIHIGADETWALGRCERCRAAMASSEPGSAKADLFLGYVGKVAAYVLSKGKRPIVWDDMFHLEKCIERIVELPRGTVVCSWSYYEFGGPSSWFWYGGRYYASRRWLEQDPGAAPGMNWLEELPEADQAVARKWWDGGEYPERGVSAVPWVRHYREQGYEVIGASCARGADFINAWSAYPPDRVDNVKHWARYAVQADMTGTIASAWTRFYSLSPAIEHWESGWYPTIAQAAFGWRPEMEDEAFDSLFEACFLEGDADAMAGLGWLIRALDTREEAYFGRRGSYLAAAVLKLEAASRRPGPVGRYARGLRLAAEFERVVFSLENGLKQNEWRLFYKDIHVRPDVDYMVPRDLKGLRAALADALEWEKSALAYCGSFMNEEEARELVLSKLHAYKERIRRLARELSLGSQLEVVALL